MKFPETLVTRRRVELTLNVGILMVHLHAHALQLMLVRHLIADLNARSMPSAQVAKRVFGKNVGTPAPVHADSMHNVRL